MSPRATVVVAATAAVFPLLLWAIGRMVTVTAERAPAAMARDSTWPDDCMGCGLPP